jgi:glycine/D-amino acid oxidase-like deaminating enzyme
VLLEARQVSSGATGRNGGHVKIKTATALKAADKGNVEVAESVAAYVDAQINAFRDVVEREKLDCEFELRRSYDVFTNEKDAEALLKSWDEHSDRGHSWMRPRQLVDAKFTEALSSVTGARATVSSPACSMVS